MRKFILTIGLIGIAIIVFALVVENNNDSDDEALPSAEHLSEVREEAETIEDAKPSRPKSRTSLGYSATLRDSIVTYAKSHLGTPYVFACAIEDVGFDCSGFTYYVFNHFGIEIPRSSRLMENIGREVPYEQAKKGDIIVFTGTNAALRKAGHVGIVIENDLTEGVKFIHSSSGNDNVGVIISQVKGTNYENRFLSVRRVL